MIHAVLSDIHGNLEALETVLADVKARGITSMVCLGDFVGYGASPNDCIERLRPLIEHAVVGNHDLAACGKLQLRYFNAHAAIAAQWTDATLTPDNRRYLEELPYEVRWRDTLLVHASPAEPGEWRYVLSATDAQAEMDAYQEAVCFIGHSHYPGSFDRLDGQVKYHRGPEIRIQDGHRYLVNVGAVGQPRDGDPRAAYVVFDDQARVIRHVRVEYDVAQAMRRILDAGLPRSLAERLQWGE